MHYAWESERLGPRKVSRIFLFLYPFESIIVYIPMTYDYCRFTPEERAKRPLHCYFPFGTGPRTCVAMRFALLEAKAALIQVLRRFTFVKAPETEVMPS